MTACEALSVPGAWSLRASPRTLLCCWPQPVALWLLLGCARFLQPQSCELTASCVRVPSGPLLMACSFFLRALWK